MDWQTHTAEHKQALLRHCCWMAELDPDYAIWAAQDYESRNPALLLNLERKVRQHVAREREKANAAEKGQ